MKHFEETRKLLEHSSFYYIIATSMDGNYSYINSNYANSFHHISEEFVGKPYHITMHPDDMQICAEVAARCFAEPDKLFPATIRKHDGKGGYLVTQWEYKAMRHEDGTPAGIFCLGYDITKYTDDLQQLTLAESEIARKEDLLSQIAFYQSHMVRAPLSNILGLVSILSKMDVDQNTKSICHMLEESARQLDEIIRKTVGLSRT